MKELSDKKSMIKFKCYLNLFQSYLDYQNIISLSFLKLWNLLKKKINKIKDSKELKINQIKDDIILDLKKKVLSYEEENELENEEEGEEDNENNRFYNLFYENLNPDQLDFEDDKKNFLNNIKNTETSLSDTSFLNTNNYQYEDIEENEGVNYIMSHGKLKRIHIDLLIKKITFENFEQNNYELFKGFINQFCSFIDKEMLIYKIINAYNFFKTKKEKEKLIPLINFLNKIIISFYYYYKELNIYKVNLVSFYEDEFIKGKLNIKGLEEIYSLLTTKFPSFELIEKTKNIIYPNTKTKIQYIKELKVKNNNVSKKKHDYFCILNYSIIDICEQLTFLSQSYFNFIERKEFLNAKYIKNNKESQCPYITKIINNSNFLSNFIIEDILSYNTTTLRAEMIERWIMICNSLKDYNNFNDCFSVQLALSSFIILNLKETWKEVKKEYKDMLNELNYFCSPLQNFKNLRNGIAICNSQPFIPFLGLLLRDISSFEEKFTYFSDNLIDFAKIEGVEKLIENFFRFRNYEYIISEREELKFFDDLNTLSNEQLEELSEKIEPKFLLSKKSDKRKTQTDLKYFSKKYKQKYKNNI